MTTMDERRAAAMALDFGSATVDSDIPVDTNMPEEFREAAKVETPATPAAPAPVVKEIPKLDEIQTRIAAQHNARISKQQAEQDARDAAEFRRLQAEGKLNGEITPDRILEVFRSLKPDERTAALRSLVTEVRSPDAAAVERTLRAELEQLKLKIVDPKQVVQQTREQLEARQREVDFEAVSGDTARFPNLARLPPEQRVAFAYEVVNLCDEHDKAYGVVTPLDDEMLATMMEQHLVARAQPTQAAPAASPTQAAAGAQDPKGPASGTLNDLAATAPSVKPRTMEEKRAAAQAMLERWPSGE